MSAESIPMAGSVFYEIWEIFFFQHVLITLFLHYFSLSLSHTHTHTLRLPRWLWAHPCVIVILIRGESDILKAFYERLLSLVQTLWYSTQKYLISVARGLYGESFVVLNSMTLNHTEVVV